MRGVAAVLLLAAVFVPENPSPRFADTGAASGLTFRFHNSATSRKYLIETMGGGVAIFDFDNDGWPDVFFVNGAALKDPQPAGVAPDKSAPEFWNRLFHNNGDGTFTDVTEKAGLRGSGYGMGVATGDYDNDGFTDLVVTSYGGAVLYHNNRDGTFTDVTAAAHLQISGWTTGAGFFDYDRDGCLDLAVCRYLDWDFQRGAKFCGFDIPGGRAYCHPDEFPPISSYLFRGHCDGTFTDVSQASGIGAAKGKALGIAFGDYNHDGLPDLYIANDSAPQMLFRNNGDGTFTDVASQTGVAYTEDGKVISGMGTVFADLDNDGAQDILTTALPYEYYALFHNTGKGDFDYASIGTGLASLTRPYGGWGIQVFDYDNDTVPELFLANGHVMDNIEVTQPHLHTLEPPMLLKYDGGKFTDISAGAGGVFQQAWAARGAAFGDLDNDGDIDIVVADYHGPAHLLRNEGGNRNHWLALDLRGTRSNRDAIGAQVRLVTAAGKVQYRMVSTAGSYLSASDRRVFFGLGQETNIREIRIEWPSGFQQVVADAQADRLLRIVEPQASAQQAFDRARGLASAGKTEQAIAALREAVKQDPDLAEAQFALGVLLARKGRPYYAEAMHCFLEVLRCNPDDADARINLSNLLEEEGDYAGAAAEMRKAVAAAKDKSGLYVVLGEKQQRAQHYAEAAASFREALRAGAAPARAHYGLGVALRHLGQPAQAAAEFHEVLRLNPADAPAHFEMGCLLAGQDRLDEAAAELSEAVRLRPAMAEAYIELGKLYRRQNRAQQAEQAFRKVLDVQPNDLTALYALARTTGLPDAEEFDRRIRQLQASRAEAGRATALNADGMRAMAEGRLEDALAAFRQALASDPAFAVAAYNIGVVLARQQLQAQAADAFRTAIRLRPSFREAHFALGLVLKAAGDPGAEEEFRTAAMLEKLAR